MALFLASKKGLTELIFVACLFLVSPVSRFCLDGSAFVYLGKHYALILVFFRLQPSIFQFLYQ